MKTLELKEFSDKLLKETESLASSKVQLERIRAILEQKNRELAVTLKRLYASHMDLVKKTSSREVERRNTRTEEGTE